MKWGQRHPYNLYCPIKNGDSTLTGCVPTAVAQLMSAYKYPAGFAGTKFPWDEMTAEAKAKYCSANGRDAIALLMRQLGTRQLLDVTYGEISGAKSENAIRTLKALGYSNPGQLNDYNIDDVRGDIVSNHPVLIRGNSIRRWINIFGIEIAPVYDGGHCWLIHGILERKRTNKVYGPEGNYLRSYTQSIWYVQCNWGWEGRQDGFFLSNAFDAINGREYLDDGTPSRASDSDEDGTVNNYQFNIEIINGIRK